MSSSAAFQVVLFCLCVANLFHRSFLGPQRHFAKTILSGLGITVGLLALALWTLNPWVYIAARVVWYCSLLLWLLMLGSHFHYLMTRKRGGEE